MGGDEEVVDGKAVVGTAVVDVGPAEQDLLAWRQAQTGNGVADRG